MSVIYKAYTVVGIRIATKDLEIPRSDLKKRGCSHDILSPDMKFCPECGKPVWIDRDELDRIIEEGDDRFGIFAVAWDTDFNHAFIGEVYSVGHYDNFDSIMCHNFPDFDDLKKSLKEALDKYDVWSEKDFGVWIVLFCDY